LTTKFAPIIINSTTFLEKDVPSQKKIAKTAFTDQLRLIPCRIEPGMFRGEYLVYLNGFDPADPTKAITACLFADEGEVRDIEGIPERDKPVSARLVVSLVSAGNGLANIILPQPAQPLGVRLLVKEDRLEKLLVPA